MAGGKLATGVAALDGLLEGGLDSDGITELYGEGGSGKTILCLQIATHVALSGNWVLYVDTEGVSLDRLESIARGRLEDVLHRLLLSTPHSLDEQTKAVQSACALARDGRRNVGLIVVDSATFYYRLTLSEESEDEGRQALALELAELLSTSLARAVPVLITNQVWRNLRDGSLEPLGGSFVNHVAKTILRLQRGEEGRRRVVVVKHRSLGNRSVDLTITPT